MNDLVTKITNTAKVMEKAGDLDLSIDSDDIQKYIANRFLGSSTIVPENFE